MQERHNALSVFTHLHEEQKTVLLKLGDSDESLFYHASCERLSPLSMTVSLHNHSLVLERLKLFGSLDVIAQLPDGSAFKAELSLIQTSNNNLTVAVLTFAKQCETAISVARFIPQT